MVLHVVIGSSLVITETSWSELVKQISVKKNLIPVYSRNAQW